MMQGKLMRFLWRIRRTLPCSRKEKRGILMPIRQEVAAFLEANPKASMNAIEARFGTPLDIAAAWLDSADKAKVLRTMQIRKRTGGAIVVSLMAVAIAYIIALSIQLESVVKIANGYSETGIIDDRSEIIDGESEIITNSDGIIIE